MSEELNSIASLVPDGVSDKVPDKVSDIVQEKALDHAPDNALDNPPDHALDNAADNAPDNAADKEVVSGKGSKASGRAFRVKLRGSVLVLLRLPNKRSVRAAIHQLSTSGGIIHLEKPLDEKLEVEVIFHIREATIRGKAQMLFPMWATQGWMQPFRFVGLSDASRESLDANLKSFLGEAGKGAAAGA